MFAQATWRPDAFAKRLALTAGVRWGCDDKDAVRPTGFIYEGAYDTVPSETCPCAPRNITETHTPVMLSVAYDWTNDAHSYAKNLPPATRRVPSAPTRGHFRPSNRAPLKPTSWATSRSFPCKPA